MDVARIANRTPRTIDDGEHAAVIAPVLDRSDPALVFTKRADHLGEHPGQMSFPGGGREPSDEGRFATALRESREEIGLRPDEVDVIGALDDIHTVTGYSVRPFVAYVPDREYVPDQREVAEIVVLDVADLVDPDNYEVERRTHPRFGDLVVHFFHVDGYTVWGATGRIVVQFLEVTMDWSPPEAYDAIIDPDVDVRY